MVKNYLKSQLIKLLSFLIPQSLIVYVFRFMPFSATYILIFFASFYELRFSYCRTVTARDYICIQEKEIVSGTYFLIPSTSNTLVFQLPFSLSSLSPAFYLPMFFFFFCSNISEFFSSLFSVIHSIFSSCCSMYYVLQGICINLHISITQITTCLE